MRLYSAEFTNRIIPQAFCGGNYSYSNFWVGLQKRVTLRHEATSQWKIVSGRNGTDTEEIDTTEIDRWCGNALLADWRSRLELKQRKPSCLPPLSPTSPSWVGFREISPGAGEERLTVSLLQQPPGFSAASRRFTMDRRTKGVAGIIAQVALLLSCSHGTIGEGEQPVRFLLYFPQRGRSESGLRKPGEGTLKRALRSLLIDAHIDLSGLSLSGKLNKVRSSFSAYQCAPGN